MATTIERTIDIQGNTRKMSFPVASGQTIYHGALAYVKNDGYLYDFASVTDAGTIEFIGIVADDSYNVTGPAATTSAGSITGASEARTAPAGDRTVRELYLDGQFRAATAGASQSDIGLTVYATDNFTFSTATGVVPIGRITKVLSSTLIEIDLGFSRVAPNNTTAGTLFSTGSGWIDHAVANSCAMKFLTSYSATSGEYACARFRSKSLSAYPVVGVNSSASAGQNDYGNLLAVQGYAQALAYTQSDASNILCGVYSCVDRTAASTGRSWSMWTDTHETVKASGGHYLHRLSHNGGAINLDGIWTLYAGQGCDYLMNFENANAPVASGDKTGGSKTYALAVNINGTPAYIQCYDA